MEHVNKRYFSPRFGPLKELCELLVQGGKKLWIVYHRRYRMYAIVVHNLFYPQEIILFATCALATN